MARRQTAVWVSGLAAAIVAFAAIVWLAAGLLDASSDPVVHRFVVPAGTRARAEAGKEPAIMPRRLDIKVGDTLVIRNDDSADQFVGPYFIRAGQTLRQTFWRAGRYQGVCTLHPSGTITIVVSPD
jgi:plastocyanin